MSLSYSLSQKPGLPTAFMTRSYQSLVPHLLSRAQIEVKPKELHCATANPSNPCWKHPICSMLRLVVAHLYGFPGGALR